MKREKLALRKAGYKFLLVALAATALLFAACDDDLDRPENQQAPEDGYVRVYINLVAEEAPFDLQRVARTTFPSLLESGIEYEYLFFKDGAAVETKKDSGAFLLEPGNYTLMVIGKVDDSPVVQGGQSFNVPNFKTVTVPLRPYPGVNGKGTFVLDITFPATATADVKLTKWDTGEGAFEEDDSDVAIETESSNDLDPGTYLLSVVIKDTASGKTAGSIEAIHIYPGLTTSFSNVYTFEQLSNPIQIREVALTIPPPRQGASPAVGSDVVSTGAYTAYTTEVVWTYNDKTYEETEKFEKDKVYSVEITLTAIGSYTFTGLTQANAKINGNTSTKLLSNDDGTVTLSLTFDKTKEVASVAITKQPKLSYLHNDRLDLSELKVKLVYKDNSTDDNIPFADFQQWGISTKLDTNPSVPVYNNTVLERSKHNNKTIIITSDPIPSLPVVKTSPLTVDFKSMTNNAAITIDPIQEQIYDRTAKTPKPVVKDGDITLVEGRDYNSNVAYSNNIDAGTAKVTISGIGGYIGSKTGNFTIKPKDFSGVDITIIINGDDPTYDGTKKEPNVFVKDVVNYLISGTDYAAKTSASYTNNINAGTNTATITLTGRGNYTGTATQAFTIKPKSPEKSDFAWGTTSFTYNGLEQEASVSFKSPKTSGIGGGFTVYYAGETDRPKDAGRYPISIDVIQGGNFTYANSLALGVDLVINTATLTPDDLVPIPPVEYNGTAWTIKPEDIQLAYPKEGLGDVSNITYSNSKDAPKGAGTYTIRANVAAYNEEFKGTINYKSGNSITVGTLTINKRTPRYDDFHINQPITPEISYKVKYDGKPQEIKVIGLYPWTSMEGVGAITVKYTNGTTVTTTAPSAKGEYDITIDVAEGPNFKQSTVYLGKMIIE